MTNVSLGQDGVLRLRFGDFDLCEADARLTRDGHPVPLPPRPFAVLCTLVRSPHMLVTKNALLDTVWGHRFVTDSGLKTAVSEIRAALGDNPKAPRYIETVSRRGYRFIGTAVDGSATKRVAFTKSIDAGIAHPASVTSATPSPLVTSIRASQRQRTQSLPKPTTSCRLATRALRDASRLGVSFARPAGPDSGSALREIGCALAEPTFATMEEVGHAHELRLQLRAYFLTHVASTTPPWSVGVD